jgi:hypothetical protein
MNVIERTIEPENYRFSPSFKSINTPFSMGHERLTPSIRAISFSFTQSVIHGFSREAKPFLLLFF